MQQFNVTDRQTDRQTDSFVQIICIAQLAGWLAIKHFVHLVDIVAVSASKVYVERVYQSPDVHARQNIPSVNLELCGLLKMNKTHLQNKLK